MPTATGLYAGNGGKPLFNEFISPIGTAVHSYHDRAQQEEDDKTKKPILDDKGFPKANFKVTLAWDKRMLDTELIPMRQMAAKTRNDSWGLGCDSDPWLNLQPFLRDGDSPEHNTKKREYLFGRVYLNFKSKAIPIIDAAGKFTGQYSGAPGLIGPHNEDLMPVDFWAGCTCRVSGIMFGTEYMGKRFISTRLNNIQKAADGERLGGGGRPDAKSQFDPLAAKATGGLGSLGGFGKPNLI